MTCANLATLRSAGSMHGSRLGQQGGYAETRWRARHHVRQHAHLPRGRADLGRYISLAATLTPSTTGARCQPDVIRGFFQDCLGDSEAAVANDAKAQPAPWLTAFSAEENGLSNLATTAGDLSRSIQSVQLNCE